jgi:hypothetical protein
LIQTLRRFDRTSFIPEEEEEEEEMVERALPSDGPFCPFFFLMSDEGSSSILLSITNGSITAILLLLLSRTARLGTDIFIPSEVVE